MPPKKRDRESDEDEDIFSSNVSLQLQQGGFGTADAGSAAREEIARNEHAARQRTSRNAAIAVAAKKRKRASVAAKNKDANARTAENKRNKMLRYVAAGDDPSPQTSVSPGRRTGPGLQAAGIAIAEAEQRQIAAAQKARDDARMAEIASEARAQHIQQQETLHRRKMKKAAALKRSEEKVRRKNDDSLEAWITKQAIDAEVTAQVRAEIAAADAHPDKVAADRVVASEAADARTKAKAALVLDRRRENAARAAAENLRKLRGQQLQKQHKRLKTSKR